MSSRSLIKFGSIWPAGRVKENVWLEKNKGRLESRPLQVLNRHPEQFTVGTVSASLRGEQQPCCWILCLSLVLASEPAIQIDIP